MAPLVLPEFWRRFLTEILIWGLLAMSSDILIGYTGIVSFGHSAFFGLGMYGAAAALLSVSPPNLWLALLYGLVGGGRGRRLCRVFLDALRDIYFAITTLIFSQIFYVDHLHLDRGDRGRERPDLQPAGAGDSRVSSRCRSRPIRCTGSCWRWSCCPICCCAASPSRRSAWCCSRSARTRRAPARSAIPIERYKIVAVMLSGLFAGLAGVLYAIQNQFAAPDFVFFLVSGEVVIYNVIGGIGTLVGPIVGAAFFLLLREGLSRFFTEYYLISGRESSSSRW